MKSVEAAHSTYRALPDGGVLVVSPARLWRDRLIEELDGQQHPVDVAYGGAEALEKLETYRWKTLLVESELPDLEASEVAELAAKLHPGMDVRLLRSSSESVMAIKEQSPDVSPFSLRCFPPRSRSHSQHAFTRVQAEPLPGMLGSSEPMLRVYDLARRVARRTTTVLIAGATGTGKEVVARAIHQLSPRASRPFVAINCAAIPETLLESELFGYARGAFTGAVQSQAGRVSAANGGTLFLDEVGELPLSIQAKLLRFIELKEIQRLGGGEVLRADVRIIAATHNDLAACVANGRFREDLFYRLAVFCVHLPRLEERADDVMPLARHFLHVVAQRGEGDAPALSGGAIRKLMDHRWPGNVRELQLVVERACILADGENEIRPEHICFPRVEHLSTADRAVEGVAV